MKRFLGAGGLVLAGILYLGVWGVLNHQTGSMTFLGNYGLLGSESAGGPDSSDKERAGHGEQSGQKGEGDRQDKHPEADAAKAHQEAEQRKQAQAKAEAQQKEAQAEADRKAKEQEAAQQQAQPQPAAPKAPPPAPDSQTQPAPQQQAPPPQPAPPPQAAPPPQPAPPPQAAPPKQPAPPKQQAPPQQPVQVQQPAVQPASVAGGGSATSGGGTATGPSGTALYPVPALKAPMTPDPWLRAKPTAAQQPGFPWPIVLVILAVIALATALGLRAAPQVGAMDQVVPPAVRDAYRRLVKYGFTRAHSIAGSLLLMSRQWIPSDLMRERRSRPRG